MKARLSKGLLATALSCLLSVALHGQELQLITLYGQVTDSRTSDALFFSSIRLLGSDITNVSNSEGCFSFKVPADTPQDASIQVSHLGYSTATVRVGDFSGHTSEKPLPIKLNPTSISLDPATVRSLDGADLILAAIARVKDNYPDSRQGMTAFYREKIRKGSSKYLSLNEAVIDIDKAPYTGFTSDRIGIFKGRGTTDYDRSDTLIVKLQGGIHTALQLDMAKYPFADVFPSNLLSTYQFSMNGKAVYDSRTFYILDFFPLKSDDIHYKGKVYIDAESLAIGRVEMSLDIRDREEAASDLFVIKKPAGVTYRASNADYVISYKYFDGKWYYDYCRTDLTLSVKKNRSPFKATFTITTEMAVTDHKSGGIAIQPSDRVRFKDILSEQVSAFRDDNFWEDYNIIEPDQSIDVIIKKIIRRLNRLER